MAGMARAAGRRGGIAVLDEEPLVLLGRVFRLHLGSALLGSGLRRGEQMRDVKGQGCEEGADCYDGGRPRHSGLWNHVHLPRNDSAKSPGKTLFDPSRMLPSKTTPSQRQDSADGTLAEVHSHQPDQGTKLRTKKERKRPGRTSSTRSEYGPRSLSDRAD